MFSGQSFSQFAFDEQDWTPPDSSAFKAFLEEATSERCFLIELDALSLASVGALSAAFSDAAFGEMGFDDGAAGVTGGVTTLRLSTHGYTSQSGDSPARTWYDGRLSDQVKVDRRVTGKDGIGGLTTVYAEAALINTDGALDTLPSNYALDGRRARVLVGRLNDPLSAYGLVFSGVVASMTVGTDELQLKLSDGQAKITLPINPTAYLGTGGLEGGADLVGKPKPKGWGHVYGISPPLVDAANLIYQVHDGAISDVPAVYDRGVLLAKVAGAPTPGQYQVTVATGTFKLGATPAGTVTCDALCDASLSGYINRAADIVLRILIQQAGLVSTEIEPSSFVQLNTDAPAEVGIWVGTDGALISDVVDALLANVGAFGGFNRQGGFSVAMLAAAAGTPAWTFTEEDIVDITRVPLPAPIEPIAWRVLVGYQKNYTTQNDLAAAAGVAQIEFAANEVRTKTAEDASIKSRHLLAQEYDDTSGLYAQAADAGTEALRRFALWGTTRRAFEIKTRPKGLTCDLGQTGQIQHSRHGLANGAPARVIAHSVLGTEVTLTVLI